MDLFQMRTLPDQVEKGDLESAFPEFDSGEYVKIQTPSSSGRMAIFKMEKVGGKPCEIKEPRVSMHKERRLQLVKSGTGRISDEEEGVSPLAKAVQYFLRALNILKPLPVKVRVKK